MNEECVFERTEITQEVPRKHSYPNEERKFLLTELLFRVDGEAARVCVDSSLIPRESSPNLWLGEYSRAEGVVGETYAYYPDKKLNEEDEHLRYIRGMGPRVRVLKDFGGMFPLVKQHYEVIKVLRVYGPTKIGEMNRCSVKNDEEFLAEQIRNLAKR